jgi:tRNA uridine 5-carboxymethylaminomethyl modification enzyme
LEGAALEGSFEAIKGRNLEYLARRPDFAQERLIEIVMAALGDGLREREVVVALNDIRYSGYLKDQESLARTRGRYDELEIPGSIDFSSISGLSNEAVQKFGLVQPRTIGQAARIPGITPAAVSILLIEILRQPQCTGQGAEVPGLP